MPDKLKPNTKAWHDRQRRHRHNGHFGSVAMAKQNMMAIITSDSTNAAAKFYAKQIRADLEILYLTLKTRID